MGCRERGNDSLIVCGSTRDCAEQSPRRDPPGAPLIEDVYLHRHVVLQLEHILRLAKAIVGAKERVGKSAGGTTPRIVIGRATESSSREKTDSELSETAYNVSDLVMTIQKEEHGSADEVRALLLSLLTSNVPGPWESSGSDLRTCAASWTEGGLLIRHSVEGHKQIRKQLELWKEYGLQQLAIEVRMISGSAKVMHTIPANWNVIDAGMKFVAPHSFADDASDTESIGSRVESIIERTHPAMFAILDESGADKLLRDAQADARTNVLQAPKITLYNCQSSRVEDLVQRPFVVAVRPVGEDAHEPLIRVVDVGWKLRLCPKVSRDGSLKLDFGVTMSDLRSVETFDLPTRRPQRHGQRHPILSPGAGGRDGGMAAFGPATKSAPSSPSESPESGAGKGDKVAAFDPSEPAGSLLICPEIFRARQSKGLAA